ncbi:DUF6515 family protein [Pseudomonas schmalbachii]|uniref:DUF6515 family protein n=1 Tax=Pseudomonas schmalbachii TaxID=2816993 RepID=UPI001F1C6B43|nr:DUF6515 family protein [Pseudomonas schmalbachii]
MRASVWQVAGAGLFTVSLVAAPAVAAEDGDAQASGPPVGQWLQQSSGYYGGQGSGVGQWLDQYAYPSYPAFPDSQRLNQGRRIGQWLDTMSYPGDPHDQPQALGPGQLPGTPIYVGAQWVLGTTAPLPKDQYGEVIRMQPGPTPPKSPEESKPSRGNWGPYPASQRPGQAVDQLPAGNSQVSWQGRSYYFKDGYWYRPMGARYMLIVPPYGVSIPYMPTYAQQVWIGAVPYFFAAGNYYIWQPDSQTYQAVSPPQGESTTLAESSYDVVAYPESGQAPEQQDRDRYECHRWAVGESDFDPAAASNAPPPDVAGKYKQAIGACLAGRGYSIN